MLCSLIVNLIHKSKLHVIVECTPLESFVILNFCKINWIPFLLINNLHKTLTKPNNFLLEYSLKNVFYITCFILNNSLSMYSLTVYFGFTRTMSHLTDQTKRVIIRGRREFGTFQSFQLTYHAHTTFIDPVLVCACTSRAITIV